MTALGFFGLGAMGGPMAMHLVRHGHRVTVHARRAEALAPFVAAGASGTTDARDLANADVIFLCLPDGDAVETMLLGDAGPGPALRAGQVVVDTSTIGHRAALRIAAALAERGVACIDAPVSGMQQRAEAGTLTVMCGGDRAAFHRVEPLLRCFGDRIVYLGTAGNGQLAKLVNQLLFDINAAALAEILPMAVKVGLDAAKVGEIVNSGTGRSYASEFFVPRILDDVFASGYPMKHAYKDLVSASELGASLGIPMPVLAAATATYQTALLQGHGDDDKGAMIKVYEALLGVAFRRAAGALSSAES